MSLPPCLATVLSVQNVTPMIRRIVFGGSDLTRFATPVGALGPYLKFRLSAPHGRICVRTYSIRRLDEDRGELHVDIVLHGGDSLGSTFATNARPGDKLALGGPGHIPAEPAAAYLVAGDHSALPAIAHILDNLPPGPEIRAIVEVPDPAEEQAIGGGSPPIIWLHRPAGRQAAFAKQFETFGR